MKSANCPDGALAVSTSMGTAGSLPAPPVLSTHPDAALLDICRRLRRQERHWQRLWTACKEDGSKPDADRRFERYAAWTWPGIRTASSIRPPSARDAARHLWHLRATTPEGLQAKARAILALEQAATWSDGRDDMMDMLLSLVRDVAGTDGVGMGDGTIPTGYAGARGCTLAIEWVP